MNDDINDNKNNTKYGGLDNNTLITMITIAITVGRRDKPQRTNREDPRHLEFAAGQTKKNTYKTVFRHSDFGTGYLMGS